MKNFGRRTARFVSRPKYGRPRLNELLKWILIIAGISAGVLAVIIFGFPFIEDLIKGNDPAERYKPHVEKEFALQTGKTKKDEYQINEMYLTGLKTKNQPYIQDNRIIFTTHDGGTGFDLNAVALYNTETEEVEILENTEKKYDNLLSPLLSGNMAVWIDSLTDGGGRIVGYDLNTKKQFLIKEYAYGMPVLSVSGDNLAFMQWAGDSLQRLYLYNLKTREAVTVKLYESTEGNSPADVSQNDLVWSEYKREQNGRLGSTLKRIVFDNGIYRYDDLNFHMNAYLPKTNGKDIAFSTSINPGGDLMLSVGGNPPTKIADDVLNYDLGDNFLVYTKDEKIHICFTDQQRNMVLTSEISKNLLSNASGNQIVFYDVTDGVSSDEVVMYAEID